MKGKFLVAVSVFALALALIAVPTTHSIAGDKIAVVVLDLDAVNVKAGDAIVISDRVRLAIFKTGTYKLVDRKLLESAIRELKLPQTGLSEKELVKLGDFLQAQKIISGQFSLMGETHTISLQILDIRTATIENMASKQCYRCDTQALFALASSAAMELLQITGSQPEPPPTPPTPPTPPAPPAPDYVVPPQPHQPLQPLQPPPVSGKSAKQLYDMATNESDINKRIQFYQQSISLDPNYAPAHNDLAVDLLDLNRVDEAIRYLQNALRIDPNYSYAHNNLGYAYRRQGKLPQAAVEFQTALRIDPNYATAHNNLGKVYLDQGNPSGALREFEAASRIKPKKADYIFNIGRAQKRLKNYEASVKAYLKCLEIDPDYIDAYYNLADLYADMGNKDAAIYYFQKYIQKETRPSEQKWVEKAKSRIQQLRGL